jgi:hypothetical protein
MPQVVCSVGEIFPGMHCLWVPDETVNSFDKQKRVIATAAKLQWHCAFNKSKTHGYYIYLNKEKYKELNLKNGSKIKIDFKADTTDLQFHFPEELEEVLATDLKAKKIFDSLTPGNKRGIIHLIAKIKSIDKRIEKSLLLAKRLKLGITSQKEIFKSENK